MRVETQSQNKFTQRLASQQQSLPKPPWLKIRPSTTDKFGAIRTLLKAKKLNTVCQEAHCPNMAQCWSGDGKKGATATFMLMGDTCTRACRFCMVKSGNPRGLLDETEPARLVEAVKIMGLDYVVLTCVTRDDLPDGGAGHFAACINALRKHHSKLLIELLISDLNGNVGALKTIVDAKPDVLGHNLETVERLQGAVRDPRANYQKSLAVLANAKKISKGLYESPEGSCFEGNLEAARAWCPKGECSRELSEVSPLGRTSVPEKQASSGLYTKSSLMLGLGETKEEIVQAMKDLRAVKVDIVTFGQYLRPSPFHIAVHEYVKPEQYKKYETIAKELGFLYCAAGPFVRSSYKAGELFLKNIIRASAGQNGTSFNSNKDI